MTKKIVAFVLLASLLGFGSAFGHPSDSYYPNDLPIGYGTSEYRLGPAVGINELTFSSPYPNPDLLTDQEKYIVAGCDGAEQTYLHQSWTNEIAFILSKYVDKYAELPNVMSIDLLAAVIANVDELDQEHIDVYKSPLTDEYPMLNVEYHSPGDVYARALSESEVIEYGKYNSVFKDVYIDRKFRPDYNSGQYYEVTRVSGPLYIRVYGWDGVIIEKVYMDFSHESTPSSD